MEEPAFDAFYQRTARRLWRYLRRISGDAALADDILQEAYLRFLRSVRAGASEPEQVSFLYRTATRLVYDEWRRPVLIAGVAGPLLLAVLLSTLGARSPAAAVLLLAVLAAAAAVPMVLASD